MIVTTETLSQIAQMTAAREAEAADANAVRFESWKRRYPYDLVSVPPITAPPSWPATRSSIPKSQNVTNIKAKARA